MYDLSRVKASLVSGARPQSQRLSFHLNGPRRVDLQIVHQTLAFTAAMANPGMERRGNLKKGPYCVY